jgi:hypothetical protein
MIGPVRLAKGRYPWRQGKPNSPLYLMFFARMTNNKVAGFAKPQKHGWLAADVSYRVNPVHNRSNTQSLQTYSNSRANLWAALPASVVQHTVTLVGSRGATVQAGPCRHSLTPSGSGVQLIADIPSPLFGRIVRIRSAFHFTRKRRLLALGRLRPFRHRATRPCSGSFEPTDVSDSDPNPPILERFPPNVNLFVQMGIP